MLERCFHNLLTVSFFSFHAEEETHDMILFFCSDNVDVDYFVNVSFIKINECTDIINNCS